MGPDEQIQKSHERDISAIVETIADPESKMLAEASERVGRAPFRRRLNNHFIGILKLDYRADKIKLFVAEQN